MASYSSTGNSNWPQRVCRCGVGNCVVKVSRSMNNYGRHYYSCPRPLECNNFIGWCDEYVSSMVNQPYDYHSTPRYAPPEAETRVANVVSRLEKLEQIFRIFTVVLIVYGVLLVVLLCRI